MTMPFKKLCIYSKKASLFAAFTLAGICIQSQATASEGKKDFSGSPSFSEPLPETSKIIEFSLQRGRDGHLRPTYIADLPDRPAYFKIEQGATFGRMLDQRMSNLHYSGPGGMLAFSRHVHSADRISEIGFARGSFHYVKPGHAGTHVYNPSLGFRYMQLRKLRVDARPDFFLGVKADLFGNMRIAPSLGNSFLFTDIVFAMQPKARVEHATYFFNRDWQFDYSLSFALFGYGLRIPEYGPTFQVTEDGGAAIIHTESGGLHPGNYGHITTGIFLREPIGGDHNPNWLRLGYVWDYFRISGNHDLNTYHASHQLVLELYFMIN